MRDRAGLGIVLVYVYKEAPFLVLLLLASTIHGPLVVDALSTTVHAYPTLAEGPSRAADERLRQKYAGPRYRALARPILAARRRLVRRV